MTSNRIIDSRKLCINRHFSNAYQLICWLGNGFWGEMGLIAVRTASFAAGLLGCCANCLTILVLGMETVRVAVFVSGLVIFYANATTLALDASINSSAAHFVSASTALIWLRIMLRVFWMSCSAVLFIQLFSYSQTGVMQNHLLTSGSTPP